MRRIGITVGDINGIGAEVTLKAIRYGRWAADTRFILIGSEGVFREQSSTMRIPVSHQIEFLEVGKQVEWRPGEIRTDASRLADAAICAAVQGCMSGEFESMVTAPICKKGFHKAGCYISGHTEYLARLTGSKKFGMLLIGGGLRVMLATRHIPLSRVATSLNERLIFEQIELTGEMLTLLGLKNGKIGVCGLNPHAGEGGLLGREEIEWVGPAVKTAQNRGFNVSGPISADIIFYEALKGGYEAVIAMYHDQGLAPLKTIGFDEGVNVTPGLPIIRTSPGHGTAFGIAGQNRASFKSMKNAIALAVKLAGKPNPWGPSSQL